MPKLVKSGLLVILALSMSACSVFGIRSEEQPPYSVLLKDKNKEVRKYEPYIVARTTVNGSFKEASNRGFKILAGYIFGKNKSKQKIAMTAPVTRKKEQESEKIAMTAPVLIAPDSKSKGQNSWTMTFSMPAKYTLDSLPKPNDERVRLETVKPKLMAVRSFTGFWSESKNKKLGAELSEWLAKTKKYKPISEPMFAGYDPPWTLPFLRRNEMLLEVVPQ